MKDNDYHPYPLEQVRHMAYQVSLFRFFRGVRFVRFVPMFVRVLFWQEFTERILKVEWFLSQGLKHIFSFLLHSFSFCPLCIYFASDPGFFVFGFLFCF